MPRKAAEAQRKNLCVFAPLREPFRRARPAVAWTKTRKGNVLELTAKGERGNAERRSCRSALHSMRQLCFDSKKLRRAWICFARARPTKRNISKPLFAK